MKNTNWATLISTLCLGAASGLLLVYFHHHGLLLTSNKKKKKQQAEPQPLSKEVVGRILTHMNTDHQEHLLLYAKHYGNQTKATAATVTHIDNDGMWLAIITPASSPTTLIKTYIQFPSPLKDAKDARSMLVYMAQEAGRALGVPVKSEAEQEIANLDPLTDTKYGLAREEMNSKKCLAGSVKKYDTHIFLLWRKASEWPKNIEDGDGEGLPPTLPQVLNKALKTHKDKITSGKVKLNVAECETGEEEGTLLLFPQEVCVKGVNVENASAVVEALLVGNNNNNIKEAQAKLKKIKNNGSGSRGTVSLHTNLPANHLFVCCHLQRDKRCGLIGPYLVKEFKKLIAAKAKEGSGLECPVRACSHVGGHTYAGNVITFSRRSSDDGRVLGDWWGYVTLIVAQDLVDRHLLKGELLLSVWRGQMGMEEAAQKAYMKERCEGCECQKTEL